jgi:hypothetical protein
MRLNESGYWVSPRSVLAEVIAYSPQAYNLLGYIEVTDQDTHHVVDVKMHDLSPESPRKGYHFTDNYKYDMASLGKLPLVLA